MVSTQGNLTVCWISPPDPDSPDGYYVTFRPLSSPTTSLWLNQSSPGARWVNRSICVSLGTFTPGQTYEVEVVSLKGTTRSPKTSIIHTTGKRIYKNVDIRFTKLVIFKLCCMSLCRSNASSGSCSTFSGHKLCTAVHPESTAGPD